MLFPNCKMSRTDFQTILLFYFDALPRLRANFAEIADYGFSLVSPRLAQRPFPDRDDRHPTRIDQPWAGGRVNSVYRPAGTKRGPQQRFRVDHRPRMRRGRAPDDESGIYHHDHNRSDDRRRHLVLRGAGEPCLHRQSHTRVLLGLVHGMDGFRHRGSADHDLFPHLEKRQPVPAVKTAPYPLRVVPRHLLVDDDGHHRLHPWIYDESRQLEHPP